MRESRTLRISVRGALPQWVRLLDHVNKDEFCRTADAIQNYFGLQRMQKAYVIRCGL